MLRRSVLSAALLALATTGCSDDDDEVLGPPESWHIGIYMAADNNLDGAASSDILEMLEAPLPPGVAITLYLDRTTPGSYNRDPVPGLPEYGGAKILRLEEDGVTEVEDLGVVDSLSVNQVHSFVKRIGEANAQRRALIFWDHGSSQSYGVDQSSGSPSLNILDVRRAFLRNPDDPTSGDYTFDVVGFDACLLGSLDALEVMAPVTDVYVASAELEPVPGWNYEGLVDRLADPLLTPAQFGRAAVEAYQEFYLGPEPSGRRVSLAAWSTDTATFNNEVSELNLAAEALVADGEAARLYLSAQQSAGASRGYNAPPNQAARVIDVGDFLGGLAVDETLTDVATTAAAARDALLADRIAVATSDDLAGTIGLSITNNAADVDNLGLLPEALGAGSAAKAALAATDVTPPEVSLTYDDTSMGTIDFGIVTFGATDDVLLTSAQVLLTDDVPMGEAATLYAVFNVEEAAGRAILDPGAYGVPLTTLTLGSPSADPPDEDLGVLYIDGFGARLVVNLTYGGSDHLAYLNLDDGFMPDTVVIEDGPTGNLSVVAWDEVLGYPNATVAPVLFGGTSGIQIGRARPVSEVEVSFADLQVGRTLQISGTAEDVAGRFTSAEVPVP